MAAKEEIRSISSLYSVCVCVCVCVCVFVCELCTKSTIHGGRVAAVIHMVWVKAKKTNMIRLCFLTVNIL